MITNKALLSEILYEEPVPTPGMVDSPRNSTLLDAIIERTIAKKVNPIKDIIHIYLDEGLELANPWEPDYLEPKNKRTYTRMIIPVYDPPMYLYYQYSDSTRISYEQTKARTQEVWVCDQTGEQYLSPEDIPENITLALLNTISSRCLAKCTCVPCQNGHCRDCIVDNQARERAYEERMRLYEGIGPIQIISPLGEMPMPNIRETKFTDEINEQV